LEKASTDRIAAIKQLEELRKKIQETREFIATSEPECRTIPEWDYYLNSMGILDRIAVWTAGRHALGVCRDVIPTKRERSQEVQKKLTAGLERLEEDPALVRPEVSILVSWICAPMDCHTARIRQGSE
jgi:hypothetical protein